MNLFHLLITTKNASRSNRYSMNRYRIISFSSIATVSFCAAACRSRALQTSPYRPRYPPMRLCSRFSTGYRRNTGRIEKLNATVADTAKILGKTGISGPDADAVLVKLPADNPAIINVITYDPNGTVLAAEPASAILLIGRSISGYEIVRKTLTIRNPP